MNPLVCYSPVAYHLSAIFLLVFYVCFMI
uniref:Uncharacterized protein n=1 Tax=Anguilla anguilla TaxID=7936 RepID=A0A0E9RVQ7_ANGAN